MSPDNNNHMKEILNSLPALRYDSTPQEGAPDDCPLRRGGGAHLTVVARAMARAAVETLRGTA